MEFSIIIPAYREEAKIGRDVAAAGAFLYAQGMSGEIIVVDDGSPDATAEAAGQAPVPDGVERSVIRLDRNRGKGCAVRTGMAASRGEYVMFADAGLCIPYENALTGLAWLRAGECDVAVGSRFLPESRILRPHRLARRVLSRGFRQVVVRLVRLRTPLSDTQCGFKLFRGNAGRELFAASFSDGFVFDLEILLRAEHRGFRIREFPVEWTNDPDSRFPSVRGPIVCLFELLAVMFRLAREFRAAEKTGAR